MDAQVDSLEARPRPASQRVAALLAGILVAIAMVAPSAAGAAPIAARAADSFVDSIGVNTHTYYTDTVYYTRFDEWRAKLADLGVRHVRENLVPNRADQYQRLNLLGTMGVKSTLIMGDPREGIPGLETLLSVAKTKIRGSLAALEGPNEFDSSGRADWRAELAAYHRRLYVLAKADSSLSSLPLIGPSIVHERNQQALGDLSRQLDYGNIHSYPDGYWPESNLGSHLEDATANSSSKQVMATETAYHTAVDWTGEHKPVSEQAMATYVPRMFLEYFRRGVARTFSYELLDEAAGSGDREDNFGLLRNDLSEKPAFVALRNTIDILEDRGPPFAPGSLDYTLGGNLDSLRQVLLQKRDGSFYLALWRASSVWDPVRRVPLSAPLAQVIVDVAPRLAAARHYVPNTASTAVSSFADPNGPLTVSVGPEVIILELSRAVDRPLLSPLVPGPAPEPAEPQPNPGLLGVPELEADPETGPAPATEPGPTPAPGPPGLPQEPAEPSQAAPQTTPRDFGGGSWRTRARHELRRRWGDRSGQRRWHEQARRSPQRASISSSARR